MKVLVTGGAGFIGSHLAEHLVKTGNKVCIIDDISEGDTETLEHIDCESFHIGDICHYDLDVLTNDVDVIYHLACRKMVYSVSQPHRDLEVNAKGTLRILEAARIKDIPVVYTSTGSIYGNPTVFPTPEDYPPKPESPYGVSKLAAEEYCRLYHRLYGLRTIILRLHSVYGSRQKTIGVIPKFIKQAIGNQPYTVEGDGTQKRTFTYIDDCIDGILLAAEKGENGEAYNLAGEKPYSILDLVKVISEILKVPVKIAYVERKKGDLDLTYPSTDKIKKLRWIPRMGLKEGIKRTVEWMKSGLRS